jgi:hypothetical protein
LLFLVHCNRPFVGPVYEFILALVRNVRNDQTPKSPHPSRMSAPAPRADFVRSLRRKCQKRKSGLGSAVVGSHRNGGL